MSELVVVSFEGKFQAEDVLLRLLKLEQASLLDLDDAVVVTKNTAGKVRVKGYHGFDNTRTRIGKRTLGRNYQCSGVSSRARDCSGCIRSPVPHRS